jgi:hypothetical protein
MQVCANGNTSKIIIIIIKTNAINVT